MAQQPPEDKKLDFSSFPRGAIGIKGLPVSRNTRLPSIRTPRDLTLGAPPKRTFMPNIPVRREKKLQIAESSSVKQENVKSETKHSTQINERGRGRGRVKNIIQTQSSIFSDGIAVDVSSRKDKMRAASSSSTSSKAISIKKEKDDKDMANMNAKMHNLLRDDGFYRRQECCTGLYVLHPMSFIDDGESDDFILKPVIYPSPATMKKEEAGNTDVKKPDNNFDPNVAKEMGFDVNRVSKFIKKEKGTESETEKVVKASPVLPKEVANVLNINEESSKLLLLKFPDFLNVTQNPDESETHQRRSQNGDTKVSENQSASLGSINSFPEGYVGKLQVLKSGKTRLVIGDVTYILNSISSLNRSKHELVSISTETKDLCVLGNIEKKLNFVPSDNFLLD